ncbi:tetratricopeptide repeat protein [Streptomyces sp. AC555_RSS877]|uniref:tetratricopeptide repeat protein n=1 Tax=Streptomyces sp. AC555_RSS877 TaxID=2823688 RepID=UPI001C276FC1|nr:tetratricopeptide repeat protein [Streptomyces sp. AC555_RSS877]
MSHSDTACVHSPDHITRSTTADRQIPPRRHTIRRHQINSKTNRPLIASEHSLGSDHPDTLTIRNNLANALFHLGRYQESASLHRLVWADRRRLLGPRHPDTRESVRNFTAATAGARLQARQSRRRRL